MLMRPPMLILDEATSSIDTMTEIRIQKAFSRLMEGRTNFVVRTASAIREADPILVMKEGRVYRVQEHMKNCWHRKVFMPTCMRASLQTS